MIRVSNDGKTLYLDDLVLAYQAKREGWTREAWFPGDKLDRDTLTKVRNAIFTADGCPEGWVMAKRMEDFFTG